MKGVIFNITEKFIIDEYGHELLEEIISKSNLITNEPFVGPGTYPDEDILEIVKITCDVLKVKPQILLYRLGVYAFEKLAGRHPEFIKGHSHPKAFLQTVERVIHSEVRKLYDDTYLPTFQYRDPAEDELIIIYFSKRKLYSFMEGLIEGVAQYFEYSIVQKHQLLTLKGNEVKEFHLYFSKS